MIRPRALVRLASPVLLAAALAAALAACSSSSSGAATSAGPATTASKATGTGNAFCDTLLEMPAIAASAVDPASAKVAYQRMTQAFKDLVASAPAGLEASATLLAGLTQRGYDLLAKYEFDFEKAGADPEMTKLGQDNESAEALAASAAVDTYSKTECGIDMSLTPTTAG